MKIYIREIKTDKIEEAFDVTDKPKRNIQKLIDGISINLNHMEYYIDDSEMEFYD